MTKVHEMEYRITSPCRGTNTYEVIPLSEVCLGKDEMVSALKKCGFDINISSDMLAIGKKGSLELTIYTRGKMIIKNAKDKHEAEQVSNKIFNTLSSQG